ncbi:uncharacterized protein LOC122850879 [Aphidius gifuensis]|uniref:uncharacterized protein LOC122850879 n=1 Tax=Aphidius gifuensis TaxID=684658 RepID=UPI001CDB62FD|nr:uncharacterized protein LOC122850879 [Aphidius gifuensis]
MSNDNIKFHDGFKFRYKSTTNNIRYFDCCQRGCKARGKISDTSGFIILNGKHNHSVDNNAENIDKFKKTLRHDVQSSMKKSRQIYDEVALNNFAAASQKPFVSIDRSMRRWRSEICPRRPESLREYASMLNSDEWKHLLQYNEGHLTVTSQECQDDDGKSFDVVNITNIELLQTIQSTEFCVDATYNVCPRYLGNLQLLTIMALIHNTFEPIFWALMPRKIQAAYETVLNQFARWTPNIQAQIFHTDYEAALSNAIHVVFPNVTIIYCYFHFLYNLLKNLKLKIGKRQMDILRGWNQGKTFYRKLMALPLFPQEDIAVALNWIESHATPRQNTFFSGLLAYIKKTWIRNIGVQKFCVFKIRKRTNNPIESYHCQLRQKIGSRPLIWEFTSGLVKVQSVTHCEIISLQNNEAVRRPPERRYKIHEDILDRAWELYENGEFDIPKFLSCANHFLRGFNNKLIIEDIESVDYFTYAPKHDLNVVPPVERIEVIQFGPDVGRLPIIPHTYSVYREVLLFENLENSLCRFCKNEIADYITIPCHHWYSCINCIDSIRIMCEREKQSLRCLCTTTITAFTRVQVS